MVKHLLLRQLAVQQAAGRALQAGRARHTRGIECSAINYFGNGFMLPELERKRWTMPHERDLPCSR